MKTLLLTATLAFATASLAAPAIEAPATYDELTRAAQTQRAARDVVAAQASIEAALQVAQTPDEKSEALLTLGAILSERKLYAQSRAAYQQLLPLVQGNPEDGYMLRLFIATTYVDEKLWPQAVEAWAQLVNDAPAPELTNAARLELANAYANSNQPDQAHGQMELLRQGLAPIIADATAQADARGLALITLGRSYQTESNFDAATQSFEAALAIADLARELQVNAFKSLGALAQKQGRDADAEAAFVRARRLLQQAAVEQIQAQQWDEAAQDYREALQTGAPGALEEFAMRWPLAVCLLQGGATLTARAELQRVIDSTPPISNPAEASLVKNTQPMAYLQLARLDIAAQHFELARTTLNKLLQYPELPTVFAGQAETMLKSLPPAPQ